MKILEILQQRYLQGKKSIAVLVDPDKAEDPSKLKQLIHLANENCIDFFFVGGSLITTPNLAEATTDRALIAEFLRSSAKGGQN